MKPEGKGRAIATTTTLTKTKTNGKEKGSGKRNEKCGADDKGEYENQKKDKKEGEVAGIGHNTERSKDLAREQRMDKIAIILERKERKTKELLRRIEDLESEEGQRSARSGTSPRKYGSLRKLKAVLRPEVCRFVYDGRNVRLSGEQVSDLLSERRGSHYATPTHQQLPLFVSSEEKLRNKRPIDPKHRPAYDAYLAHLGAQVFISL